VGLLHRVIWSSIWHPQEIWSALLPDFDNFSASDRRTAGG
jgi:hypothetical protein